MKRELEDYWKTLVPGINVENGIKLEFLLQ
jgi:hypothetical protein